MAFLLLVMIMLRFYFAYLHLIDVPFPFMLRPFAVSLPITIQTDNIILIRILIYTNISINHNTIYLQTILLYIIFWSYVP